VKRRSAGVRIAPYAFAILCFILPFVEVSCSGVEMASYTGVQLVAGTEVTNSTSEETDRVPPNGLAITALAALVVGLLLSLSPDRTNSLVAGAMGVVSLASMLLLKVKIDARVMKVASGFPVSVDYKAGYWGLCIASLVGALLAFMRARDVLRKRRSASEGPRGDRPPTP